MKFLAGFVTGVACIVALAVIGAVEVYREEGRWLDENEG